MTIPTLGFFVISVVSLLFFLAPPRNINSFYGYRTPRSMKSQYHWQLANKMASKWLLIISIIDMIVSAILFDVFEVKLNYKLFFCLLFLPQVAVLIFLVERKLHRFKL